MTDNDPRAALERAAEAAKNLHAASDELSKRLLRFEKLLLSQKLGTSADVNLVKSYETGDTWVELFFGKHGGKWGLFVVAGRLDVDDSPDNFQYTPIAHASREHRLLAVDMLPSLVEALEAAVESQLSEVNAANERVEQLIAQLSNGSTSEAEG